MVEHNNAIPNAVTVEEAMLLLATALEGRLEESDRPRLEQALLCRIVGVPHCQRRACQKAR